MARSLGLAAYRAFSRRGTAPLATPAAARPKGQLVWCHAAEPGNLLAIEDLAARLCRSRQGLSALITVPRLKTALPSGHAPRQPNVFIEHAPDDHPDSVAAFLTHWHPDTCIWTWGRLQPNLIMRTSESGCPMFLIDADKNGFDGRRERWLRELTHDLLTHFSTILTRSEEGFQRLTRLGIDRDAIEVTYPLQAGGQALGCIASDLADLSTALVGRPIWFANHIQQDELETVLAAHRQALLLSHRLLLILRPADARLAPTWSARLATLNFRAISWDDGTYPDDATQVMLSEDPAETGLFYRIAPVSFLGSSLSGTHEGCDPFEAAALGSAVLYGPRVRRFLPSYTRLAAEGAARIVNDAAALGTAVSRLVAPDQAAVMAHAGWDVVSRGAALTDRVVDLVQDALDLRAAGK